MADTVRYLLEEMVPELEDLERRGYFSRPEIRQIVAKRQEFEYALKRRASVQADYLRYIEYEGALERLRQLRRKERGAMGAPGLADHCIVRRTHFIYERMLRKFRGDLALWARWLRFCQRSASSRQMSKVLTRALQLHSTCAPLWTHAAAWEFEHNSNAAAARALMQRGLRMCKGADGLWHEYFRMEALYAARLAARREVLGIGGAGGDGEGEGSAGSAAPADAATAKVLRGAIARVVYASAVAAVPGSLPFRAKFLDVLRPLSLPGRAELEVRSLRCLGGGGVGWRLHNLHADARTPRPLPHPPHPCRAPPALPSAGSHLRRHRGRVRRVGGGG
jgi:U3 small nucleolar RNA-associated protein 6